jgi:hypothetical protein
MPWDWHSPAKQAKEAAVARWIASLTAVVGAEPEHLPVAAATGGNCVVDRANLVASPDERQRIARLAQLDRRIGRTDQLADRDWRAAALDQDRIERANDKVAIERVSNLCVHERLAGRGRVHQPRRQVHRIARDAVDRVQAGIEAGKDAPRIDTDLDFAIFCQQSVLALAPEAAPPGSLRLVALAFAGVGLEAFRWWHTRIGGILRWLAEVSFKLGHARMQLEDQGLHVLAG